MGFIGAERNYSSGQKITWRGWQWNKATQYFAGRNKSPSFQRYSVSDKTALFLLGKDANDYSCAISRGFSGENLIGCDVNSKNIARARKRGILAVNSRIEVAAIAWPESWKVDFVVADFCCGLSRQVLSLLFAMLTNRAFHGCRLCINMQRGRDSESAVMRDMFGKNNTGQSIAPVRIHALQMLLYQLMEPFYHRTFFNNFSYKCNVYFDSMQGTIRPINKINSNVLVQAGGASFVMSNWDDVRCAGKLLASAKFNHLVDRQAKKLLSFQNFVESDVCPAEWKESYKDIFNGCNKEKNYLREVVFRLIENELDDGGSLKSEIESCKAKLSAIRAVRTKRINSRRT